MPLHKNNLHVLPIGFGLLVLGALPAQAETWCPAEGCQPVLAGVEHGENRFVCRAQYEGGVHPGKTVAGRCNISYGGKEYPMEHYQLLYAHGHWGGDGDHPLVAGHERDGTPLLLCRGPYNGATHPGKVVGNNCNIGWGGNEVLLQNYELYFEDR